MRRIRSGPVKIGLVVGAYVVGFLLALLVAASAGMTASMVFLVAAVCLVVLYFTRMFRGEDESDAPRLWWKMTAAPTSGFLFGTIFILQAGSLLLTRLDGDITRNVVTGVAAIAYVYLGAAFIRSSVRLIRNQHGGNAPVSDPTPR